MKKILKSLAVSAVLVLAGAGVSIAGAPASTTQNWTNFTHWLGAGHIAVDSALNKGSVTCASSAGTATVTAGSVCVCSEQTDVTKLVKCSVSSTTLTIGCTTADVISYLCL